MEQPEVVKESKEEKEAREELEYTNLLKSKTVSELKNLITTIVKNVRFNMNGAKKADMIDHLVRYTKYYKSLNYIGLRLATPATLANIPENFVRDTSVTASGAPRKTRNDKGTKKIKESKTIEKIVVPMPVKKVAKDSKKMASDKAKTMPVVKHKMLPTVAETGYVKKVLPPGLKLRKKRSDAGEPRKKKDKTIQ